MRDVNILKTCVVHMTRPYSTGTLSFFRFGCPSSFFNFLIYKYPVLVYSNLTKSYVCDHNHVKLKIYE